MPKKTPSSDDLARHFLTKGDDHGPLDISCIHTNQYVEVLDKPVSIEEVYESANRLKEKSTCDGWCPQMIKSIHPTLYPAIMVLFGIILSCAFFLIKWCLTLVATIFKNKGNVEISKYYRPVSLVHLLYKWFDFLLLKRFQNWFSPADEQTAYQQGKSCSDHIFLLRCLISFTKLKKETFYICTVDFDGAFDRVS